MISFPNNGGTTPGYLAIPPSGKGPGMVVIQEWWGLVPHIKDVCDRFARQGYTALAVDLYHGETTTEPNEAAKKAMALNLNQAGRDMSAAVSWLVASDHVTGQSVGVVGFCMGGRLALYLTTLRPEVGACVMYYGAGDRSTYDLSKVKAAVLGHWASNDHSTPRDTVDSLQHDLQAAGVPVQFYWYDGCDHAFFNDARPEVYNAAAAQLSWKRTLDFCSQNLGHVVSSHVLP